MENSEKKISKKELARRKKISRYRKRVIKERQKRGYREWLKLKHREMRKRETQKRHEKEKEKRRKERERLKKLKLKKKRPVVRPKKRGPNKKRNYKKKPSEKKKTRKLEQKLPKIEYRIVQFRNGKHNRVVGKFDNIVSTYEEFHRLLEESKNVIFKSTIDAREWNMPDAIDEYVIITNVPPENDNGSYFRNEFGMLVKAELNSDSWFIVDKARFYKEETFWVWGYDKVSDRKTFMWIYEIILPEGIETIYDHKRIMTFRNKVIFKPDNGTIDLILCKHTRDAIKFYNMLQEFVKKDKLKQYLFIGDFSKLTPKRKKLEEEIFALTGWPLKKIRMSSTTFYTKK